VAWPPVTLELGRPGSAPAEQSWRSRRRGAGCRRHSGASLRAWFGSPLAWSACPTGWSSSSSLVRRAPSWPAPCLP